MKPLESLGQALFHPLPDAHAARVAGGAAAQAAQPTFAEDIVVLPDGTLMIARVLDDPVAVA